MKFKPVLFLIIVLALASLACSSLGDPADPSFTAGADPLDDLIAAATVLLASLIGIPAFVASALTLLEHFRLIGEEQSDKITLYLNTGLYLIALAAVLTGRVPLLLLLDHYLGGFAPILTAILAFLSGGAYSVIQTKRYHLALRQFVPYQRAQMARINSVYAEPKG